jgi:hypothetical protein
MGASGPFLFPKIVGINLVCIEKLRKAVVFCKLYFVLMFFIEIMLHYVEVDKIISFIVRIKIYTQFEFACRKSSKIIF